MSRTKFCLFALGALAVLAVVSERPAAAQGCTAARGCPTLPPSFAAPRNAARANAREFDNYRNVSNQARGGAINLTQRAAPLPNATGNIATIRVTVPAADAKLTFQGVETEQQGESRLFTSPPLAGRGNYRYVIRCTWQVDGQEASAEQAIMVRGGEETAVDFGGQPEV